jgi:hypothetical protein
MAAYLCHNRSKYFKAAIQDFDLVINVSEKAYVADGGGSGEIGRVHW